MKKILALNGVHTAGKSTLGERLEEEESFNYLPEIAQEIIDEEDADWGDEGDHVFQKAIHEGETHRDRSILQNGADHAIVETWHFGNIAHSMETARPELVDEQEEYFQVFDERTDAEIYAVFLDMPLERIWDRSPHFEEGDNEVIDFYDNVRENHFELYDKYGIEHIIVENNGSLDEAYGKVREFAYEALEK